MTSSKKLDDLQIQSRKSNPKIKIVSSGDQQAGTYLEQRITMAIQRGNTTSLLGTLPTQVGDFGSVF